MTAWRTSSRSKGNSNCVQVRVLEVRDEAREE